MSAIVNITPAVKTVNLTKKDNFVTWDKYYVRELLCVKFNMRHSGNRLLAHIKGEPYIDVNELDFADTWCKANVIPSMFLPRPRRTESEKAAGSVLAPLGERDERRASMVFSRETPRKQDHRDEGDDEELAAETPISGTMPAISFLESLCVERIVNERHIEMLQKQYYTYVKEATDEEVQIFTAMVLVVPSDVKDTLSTSDREKWTQLLAAQNPYKLYDHMKEKLNTVVSDKVQDKIAELAATKQEPGESLAAFLGRLQEIFDQLSAYGAERTDQQKGYVLVNNTRVEVFKDKYKKYAMVQELPSFDIIQKEYQDEEKAIEAVETKLGNQQTTSGISTLLSSVTPARVHFQSEVLVFSYNLQSPRQAARSVHAGSVINLVTQGTSVPCG